MSWAPERTSILRTMWADGATAAEVAEHFGDVTISAVTNKKLRIIGPEDCNWTAARVEQLTRLWDQDLTAAEIVVIMGGTTRSAVLGKVRRLNLPMRRGEGAPKKARKARGPRGKPKHLDPGVRDAPSIADFEIPQEQLRTLMGLEPSHCRWPIGDPSQPDLRFCGAHAQDGRPYCAGHAARAYQAPRLLRSREEG